MKAKLNRVLDGLDRAAGVVLKWLRYGLKIAILVLELVVVLAMGLGAGVLMMAVVVFVSALVSGLVGWLVSVIPFLADAVLSGLALFGLRLEPNQLPLFFGTLGLIAAFFAKGQSFKLKARKTREQRELEELDKLMGQLNRTLH